MGEQDTRTQEADIHQIPMNLFLLRRAIPCVSSHNVCQQLLLYYYFTCIEHMASGADPGFQERGAE